MSRRAWIVTAVVVVAAGVVALLVVVLNSHDDKKAAPPASTTTEPPTTRPVARTTVRAPSSSTTTTIASVPTITLPPPYTSAQLETALLQNGDLPTDSTRSIVPAQSWGGVCGSSAPAVAPPFSAAAVEFTGPQALHAREDLADYGGDATGYLDAVRQKISCGTYVPDGQPTSPITVTPIAPDVINGGLDTHSGADGVGVKTVDSAGRRSFHVWVRHGNLIISLQDDARTATAVSAVQLAQLALQRVEGQLA